MKKIFVGNLSWKSSEDQLKTHFERFGKVVSAKIVTDQMTGKSKGFGFVEMENANDAETAIRELNGQPLGDRNLRVSLAQERERTERREPRSFGGDRPSFGERRNYRSN